MKKKHIVLARNKKISDSGMELDGKHIPFAGKGAAVWIEDEGKARALQQKYPRDIAVTLDQQYTWHANNEGGNGTRMDNIHKYTFAGMGLRETMYDFSKDPDFIQIRPGVWQLKKKAIQKPKLRGRGAKPAGARNARGKKDELSQPA